MNLPDSILEVFLTDYHSSYRAIRRVMSGRPLSGKRGFPDDNTLSVALYRLKKKGFVKREDKIWKITERGKSYINKIILKRNWKSESKSRPKNLIIAFDLPQKYVRERRLLRADLLGLNFSMLQKSLWFGPGPLPEEFIRSLDRIKILRFVKFFEAKEKEII